MEKLNPETVMGPMAQMLDGIEWVTCPSCNGEWNQLHPCDYFWMDKRGRNDGCSYLCVDCAESLRGLMFCSRTWPAAIRDEKPLGDIFWPSDTQPNWDDVEIVDAETGKKSVQRVMRWGRLQGRVRYLDEVNFTITARNGGRIAVWRKEDEPMIFGNIVAAWHWIKSQVEKGPQLPALGEQENFRRVR